MFDQSDVVSEAVSISILNIVMRVTGSRETLRDEKYHRYIYFKQGSLLITAVKSKEWMGVLI
jgi:hypothetical protein